MFKNGLKSVGMMLRYSPVQTVLMLVMMFVASGFAALTVYINKNLVDSVGEFVREREGLLTVCCWVLLLFGSILFGSFRSYFGTRVDISMTRNLMKRFVPMLMGKLNRIEYSAFEASGTHDLIERMSKSPQTVIINCFNKLVDLCTCAFSIAGLILYFMSISIVFTVVYVLLLAVYCCLTMMISKQYQKYGDKKAECKRKAVYFNNLLTQKDSLAELHILNGEDYIFGKWKEHLKSMYQDLFWIKVKANGINLLGFGAFCVWIGFMLIFSTRMVLSGEQTPGFFVAVVTSLVTLSSITERISWAYGSFVSACMSYDYFERFMELPERAVVQNAVEPESMEIRFEDVWFSYPGTDAEILKGVSFVLKEGERISIVGENGAGKSTLIKLLCGLYAPDRGRITVGGVELCKLSDDVRKRVFSVVFQDFGHYSMTLRENVAFGDIAKVGDDEAIYRALREAMGEEILDGNAKGLWMNLGKLESDGVDLSGGQWQRVSIARAFFSDARYVILDEPTAALDPLAESRMYEGFASVLKKRGAITISHRLASAKMSDRILVLAGGCISEEGSHEELMEMDGLYAKMFRAQAGWYEGKKE